MPVTGADIGIQLLQNQVTKDATPQYKLEARGAFGSLKLAHDQGNIIYDKMNGHYNPTIRIKRKQRVLPSQVVDDPGCDTGITIPYIVDTVDLLGAKGIAFHIPDETIAAFETYASSKSGDFATQPATQLMWEFNDNLKVIANAILASINSALITDMITKIGVNRVTGVNTAQTLNLPLNTTNNNLASGFTQLMTEWKKNNMSGKPIIVGAGLMYAHMLQQPSKSPDQSGFDTRVLTAQADMFYDDDFATALNNSGNQIVAYEKNAVQLIEYMKYRGFKNMDMGIFKKGVLTIPMDAGNGVVVPVQFDYHLRYNDCPSELFQDGDYDTTEVGAGWNLILSKSYGMYYIPTDAYKVGDVLYGNRGSLRYAVTNS